jgi:DNA-binding MltR family transcriptional regulator
MYRGKVGLSILIGLGIIERRLLKKNQHFILTKKKKNFFEEKSILS